MLSNIASDQLFACGDIPTAQGEKKRRVVPLYCITKTNESNASLSRSQMSVTHHHTPTLSRHVSNSAEVVAYICSSLELPVLEALNTMAYFSAMSPYITTPTYPNSRLKFVCNEEVLSGRSWRDGSGDFFVYVGWRRVYFKNLCKWGAPPSLSQRAFFAWRICTSLIIWKYKYFLSFRVNVAPYFKHCVARVTKQLFRRQIITILKVNKIAGLAQIFELYIYKWNNTRPKPPMPKIKLNHINLFNDYYIL